MRITTGALFGVLGILAMSPCLAEAHGSRAKPADLTARALKLLETRSAHAHDTLRVHAGPYGLPRYLSGVLSEAKPSGRSTETHARQFLAGQAALFPIELDALELIEDIPDEAGGSHLVFQQHLGGVPVYKGTLVVHLDRQGVVRGVTSNAAANFRIQAVPSLEPGEVAAALKERLGATDVRDMGNATLLAYPTRAGGRLVYQVPVVLWSVGPRVTFVDAQTGELFLSENPLRDGMVTGSGVGVDGQTITDLAIYKGKFFRTDVSPLFSVYIQNASKGAYNLVDLNTPDLGKIYTFTSNQTYLMDVDYVSSRDSSFDDSRDINQPPGVTAHDFFRTTLDFYKDTYGRNGIDGNGLSISAVVEVNGIPGYPLECNAGWLGYGYNFMMFGMGGDCFGYEFPSFTAGLDVIGHELNHGVNEFTINLGYNHESGALNEHFADVFGLMVEDYAQSPNWLIGDDLFTDPNVPWTAFRSFADPASEETIMPQPDHMEVYFASPVSYDAGGVHFNSGIVNKAFYLAVAGGTYHGVTVPPLASSFPASLALGGKLWYDVMNSRRLSAISQFNDTRDALLDAAEALAPSAATSISAAFQAVGVVDDLYPSSSQDPAEPNDYPGLASTLSVGDTTEGRIWAQNDTDIYALELSSGQSVTITLSGLTYDARLAVYSVGAYSTLKEEAASANAGTVSETLSFRPATGGIFYVEVMPEGNAGSRTSPYTLSVVKG